MYISSFREEELRVRIIWFIRLRWLFLLGLFSTVLIATQIFRVVLPLKIILAIGGAIFAYNLALHLYHHYTKDSAEKNFRQIRTEANLQIILDLFSLTLLIHYSGGLENPFIMIYLLHAIIASILLSRAEVWILALVTFSCCLLLIILEYFGVIHHYHLANFFPKDIHRDLVYVTGVILTVLVSLFATIYISSTIVQGLWVREAKLFLAQKLLQKQSEELQQTNLVKQKQLVQAEKLASLGQLVSGCAHEINNPIQFILGNMRILKESFEDLFPLLERETRNRPDLTIARLSHEMFVKHIPILLGDMTTGAERIRDIILDLKTFARLDEGRLDEEVDLNEVAQICERLVHNKIKRYRVEEKLAPQLPKVRGSRNKLEQVVMASLINAAEALGNLRNGTIQIATRIEAEAKSVSLSISDNGPGMTEEVKSRIFDPFFTTKQRTGGTGLGLSISHGIIKEHGGYIEVRSRIGKGATFIFHLPVSGCKGAEDEPNPGD
ncbi:MAG: hypothetical protein A2V67_06780 [Deltaproteobacteria bacterium RBG_13_61_14]|nr:MAG: hypothetical protein A2V67_06780 [Deltaproteobacteria bacterium RBG_13_61_14]